MGKVFYERDGRIAPTLNRPTTRPINGPCRERYLSKGKRGLSASLDHVAAQLPVSSCTEDLGRRRV